jgi:hypothetical protein
MITNFILRHEYTFILICLTLPLTWIMRLNCLVLRRCSALTNGTYANTRSRNVTLASFIKYIIYVYLINARVASIVDIIARPGDACARIYNVHTRVSELRGNGFFFFFSFRPLLEVFKCYALENLVYTHSRSRSSKYRNVKKPSAVHRFICFCRHPANTVTNSTEYTNAVKKKKKTNNNALSWLCYSSVSPALEISNLNLVICLRFVPAGPCTYSRRLCFHRSRGIQFL